MKFASPATIAIVGSLLSAFTWTPTCNAELKPRLNDGHSGLGMRHLIHRDASTNMSKGANNEGEAHTAIVPPKGSAFTSLAVGNGGEQIAAYWTKKPQNSKATQAFIMIHGKLRNGNTYFTTMQSILSSAIAENYPNVDKNAIIVAPQFFSTYYNSGQYTASQLGWGDVNAWQAGDIATHPSGTKLTSFDALDALVDEFMNSQKYPNMQNVTVVGHGGGGQLNQRYAMVAKNPANPKVHVRYIHGDPSSCAYFTNDRPQAVAGGMRLSSKTACPQYNTWRYGFDNFTGTADGLKTPKQYFQQYISRDVVSIVGYQDVKANGDDYCMARMQGGMKRRDRNLTWWQYINTLARTNEDLNGFPATFGTLPDWSDVSGGKISTRLTVVQNADHNAKEVFGAPEGRAALFSKDVLNGWRPSGWQANGKSSNNKSPSASSASANTVRSNTYANTTPQQETSSNARSAAVSTSGAASAIVTPSRAVLASVAVMVASTFALTICAAT